MYFERVCVSFLGLTQQSATNLVVLTVDIYFLTVLQVRSSKSRCQQSWFPLRAVLCLSLRCWWFASSCWYFLASSPSPWFLHSISHGLVPVWISVPNFPFLSGCHLCWIMGPSYSTYDLILTNYICDDPVSK